MCMCECAVQKYAYLCGWFMQLCAHGHVCIVCMHACTFMCADARAVFVYVDLCVYIVYSCVHESVCIRVYEYLHMCIQLCVSECMCVYKDVYLQMCMYVGCVCMICNYHPRQEIHHFQYPSRLCLAFLSRYCSVLPNQRQWLFTFSFVCS